MNGTSPMHRPLARAIAASTAVVLSLSLLLAPPAVSEETDEPPADPNLWDYFWNGLTHAVGGGSFGAVIHKLGRRGWRVLWDGFIPKISGPPAPSRGPNIPNGPGIFVSITWGYQVLSACDFS